MAGESNIPPEEVSSPAGDETVRLSARRREGGEAVESDFRHGRFEPGARLGSRYRIVAKLGEGGMGEVYRADDLELGQSVALKFLPERVAADPAWLRRFRNEVRTARQIAHPNICRIYDIGEVDGHIFLSMEYIDGEDLGGVLRRMGRPSREKAIEIARQICLGLAAAHESNVLHRDLKPANIMIDGRGRVRITDFGLAGFLDEFEGAEMKAGTPAYMAPEQLAHGKVSVRSDVYTLGLVLHELFTGQSVFETNDVEEIKQRHSSGTATPSSSSSSIAEEIDPAVDRVITRCLEATPEDRPQSVYQVLAALPGGDPLAAALAAGETPSPELVAASGERGGLPRPVALALLAALVVIAPIAMVLIDKVSLLNRLPTEKPPEVLRDRALSVIKDLGHDDSVGDTASHFHLDMEPYFWAARTFERPNPWAPLEGVDLPLVVFRARTSPDDMVRLSWTGAVRWTRPPFDQPGMTRLTLDLRGNLMTFEAVPPGRASDDSITDSAAIGVDMDWSPLFRAAGLDHAAFSEIEPDFVPSVYCDELAAWRGEWPGAPDIVLEARAGAVDGRVAYFDLRGPWQGNETAFWRPNLLNLLMAGIVVIGFVFMFRHLRSGRGDRQGAFRLALFIFVIAMLRWVFSAHHVDSDRELDPLLRAFGMACGLAVITWTLYLAAEPFARRYWPQSLISWTRLLTGRFRDPRIGRDALVGVVCATAILCIMYAPLPWRAVPDPEIGIPAPGVGVGNMGILLSDRFIVTILCNTALTSLLNACGLLVMLLILRLVFRNTLLAAGGLVLVFLTIFGASLGAFHWEPMLILALFVGSLTLLLVRFGLLALILMLLTLNTFEDFAATFDFSRWYAGASLAGPLFILAIALYGFYISLAGRPILRDMLAEPKPLT